MREREDEETRTEQVRAPLAKTEKRERERRLDHRLETDPDNPTIVRGVD
ncbi:MAG: hypothetical protein SFX73_12890 [Kofleriaceae bacterium]|nr:hypothetical protein [Kofleriaceae bacterium]